MPITQDRFHNLLLAAEFFQQLFIGTIDQARGLYDSMLRRQHWQESGGKSRISSEEWEQAFMSLYSSLTTTQFAGEAVLIATERTTYTHTYKRNKYEKLRQEKQRRSVGMAIRTPQGPAKAAHPPAVWPQDNRFIHPTAMQHRTPDEEETPEVKAERAKASRIMQEINDANDEGAPEWMKGNESQGQPSELAEEESPSFRPSSDSFASIPDDRKAAIQRMAEAEAINQERMREYREREAARRVQSQTEAVKSQASQP